MTRMATQPLPCAWIDDFGPCTLFAEDLMMDEEKMRRIPSSPNPIRPTALVGPVVVRRFGVSSAAWAHNFWSMGDMEFGHG